MTPERYRQVVQLFDAAVALGGQQRLDFLDRSCGDDGELRRQVEAMLKSDESPAGLLGEPVGAVASAE